MIYLVARLEYAHMGGDSFNDLDDAETQAVLLSEVGAYGVWECDENGNPGELLSIAYGGRLYE